MQSAYQFSTIHQILEEKNITDLHFISRLEHYFPKISDLFEKLYLHHPKKEEALKKLLEILLENFDKRDHSLKKLDLERVQNPNWFSSEKIVGMMLYTDRFNENFKGVQNKIPYFKNLGINTLHLMPFLEVPEPENDGGYAVKNYRETNPKLGTMQDFENLAKELHLNEMNVVMDFVLNHCADSHEWAIKAKNGEEKYKDYFYFFTIYSNAV